jgi:hypothetical protein
LFSNAIGEGKLFATEEMYKKFLQDPEKTQNEKKKILMIASEIRNTDKDNAATSNIRYLSKTTIETSYNHCIVDCYAVTCTEKIGSSIAFKDGEVQWGEWMTNEELNLMLLEREGEFVPDGLQVWKHLLDLTRP